MAWLSPEQKHRFWQFLEPNPPKNRRGNLGIRDLSFYSSELKNVAQIIDELRKIEGGTFDAGKDPKTYRRYLNTLRNLQLVQDDGSGPLLLNPATEVLQLANANPDLVQNDAQRSVLTQKVDRIIFDSLLDAFCLHIESPDTESDLYFATRLYNAQVFIDGIPESKRATTLDDLDHLLFLYTIFAAGYEVERFFRLDDDEQIQAFKDHSECLRHFPNSPPADPMESLTHLYLAPFATNRIQKDIRYRVQAFLKAYITCADELGHSFPRFDSAQRVINPDRIQHSRRTNASLRFSLPAQGSVDSVTYPRQWLINGCPGSGKSHHLDHSASEIDGAKVLRTTFHPETSYFDFVGAYKPMPVYEPTNAHVVDAEGREFPHGRPLITYQFAPGPLVQALAYAYLNPGCPIIVIVEELNRANASAVFGDIFQLLDRDSESGNSRFCISPQPELGSFLENLGIDTHEGIYLPHNLFLWATMNNADQGVFPLDSAFRRRWEFQYKGHRTPCEYNADSRQLLYGGEFWDWERLRSAINEVLINEGIHEDKLVGPYFLTPTELASPTKVLYKLFLYLWDDALRFQHRKLMDYASFDELERAWDDGHGAPLSLS